MSPFVDWATLNFIVGTSTTVTFPYTVTSQMARLSVFIDSPTAYSYLRVNGTDMVNAKGTTQVRTCLTVYAGDVLTTSVGSGGTVNARIEPISLG
jgi:hypothetical protein